MTKWQLFSALAQHGSKPTTLTAKDGGYLASGIVQSVERESASGSSFKVRIKDDSTGDTRNVYVITQD